MKKRYYIVIAALLFGASVAKAQDHIKLDLQKTIQLANDSSLEAFRTQNMYLSGYWEYRTYKANRLPSLTLNMTPAEYNRDITKRYDSEKDLDVYRSQQSFYASGNLAIQQNFDLTGGTFYLQSQLGYMRSFGGNKTTQFTSVPIRLGYSQSLVGYNSFKWERKIEPLKYEKVKKEFVYNVEAVSVQATTYFFNLAMAQAEYNLAKENMVSSDTLYSIGVQRQKIAAISKADLLTLKLDVVNARNTLQNKASALKRAMFSLVSFLNLDKNTVIDIDLPVRPQELVIPVDKALQMAHENNPQLLGLKQNVLEAERNVDKTKKESRFNASVNASIGFNHASFPPFASSAKGQCRYRQAGAGRQPRCHYLSPVVDVSSRLRGGKPSRCGSPPAPACCRQTRSTRYCLLPQLLLSYPSSYFLLSSSANRIISAPLSSTAVTAWLNASPSGSTSP